MEVLDTRPLSQLVTEATVKVCWVDDKQPNRNNTLITEQVGREIAATLPGAPVVGFFKEEDNDFQQHSVKITIEDDSIKFESLTRPYGFVAPEKQPWYQKFMEDGIERTYLMCKAYLWTTQYPEAKMALGKGQSMELNPDSISGYYDGDVFVFTAATMDRLCILGDAFEPCFEGARIATSFSRLYTDFAQEVQKIIGGRYSIMDGKLMVEEVVDEVTEETVEEAAEEVTEEATEEATETESESETATTEAVEFTADESQETEEVAAEEAQAEQGAQEFVAQQEAEAEVEEAEESVEDSSSEDQSTSTESTEFTAQLDTLNKKIQELEQQLNTYKQKEASEQEEKKANMLNKYRKVLSAEEISSIEDNVADYSLDDLEAKLSVIFARKTLVEDEMNNIQFNLPTETVEDESLPDFVRQALAIDELKFNI